MHATALYSQLAYSLKNFPAATKQQPADPDPRPDPAQEDYHCCTHQGVAVKRFICIDIICAMYGGHYLEPMYYNPNYMHKVCMCMWLDWWLHKHYCLDHLLFSCQRLKHFLSVTECPPPQITNYSSISILYV